ncbi:MAG TPA: sulfotransferase [Candidatus Binataceae bacterium]
MALRIVGAGFGRTGTVSLKEALEKLGFGPCYHMLEVLERPDHIEMWHRLAYGGSIDWDLLFKDYQSAVDWPAARYWRELADHYPDAKVLLSLRDPESWYKSMSDTIFQGLKVRTPGNLPQARAHQAEMARKIIVEDTFAGNVEDKAHAIAVYNRHNEQVRRTIQPGRLLVFEARQGWEPLCRFLGVAVPDEPFPHLNDTASMQARMKQMRESGRV